jgi:type IV pilus assembly protein PilY1
MRFGMMTFDSDPDPGTGVTVTPTAGQHGGPVPGHVELLPGLERLGGRHLESGDPVNCMAPQASTVGARNPGAPPWEGRMVGFPAAATPDLAHQESNNDEIASVILASRPYGATPTAGMFAGAQYYFWTDPTGPQKTDPYVQGNCRNEYIIFLTDGAPNLDLQPSCSHTPATGGTKGTCPFPIPYSSTGTAATLYAHGVSTASQSSVQTYVIGFALSDPNSNPINCAQYAQAGQCNCNDANLANEGTYGPCCVLQCLAQNGGTTAPYFAQTQGQLQAALGAILANIASNATTRTTPAYSPVITNVLSTTASPTQSNESIYLASFNPSPGLPWSGDMQRQRYVCTYSGSGYTIPPPVITTAQGDDFARQPQLEHRPFAHVHRVPTEDDGDRDGVERLGDHPPLGDPRRRQRRPEHGHDVRGRRVGDRHADHADGHGLLAPCPYTSNLNGAPLQLSTTTCTTMLLDYTFGQQTFSGQPSTFTFVSRYGNALGSIYHATPTVVGPPGSLLQDPGYIGFASQWQASAPPRRSMRRRTGARRVARRSSTRRPTTACSTRSGRTRRSSRTTSSGPCCCRRRCPTSTAARTPRATRSWPTVRPS